MFAWLASWFYDPVYSGPARNAPNAGIDIKKFIENKSPEINLISEKDIIEVKNKLIPTELQEKPSHYVSPLMNELNNVFNSGYKNYFETKKSKTTL